MKRDFDHLDIGDPHFSNGNGFHVTTQGKSANGHATDHAEHHDITGTDTASSDKSRALGNLATGLAAHKK